MKILNFTEFKIYENDSKDFIEFKIFCENLLEKDLTNLENLNEGLWDFLKSIPGKLKSAWEFIKEIGKVLGTYIKDFVKALMNNYVYSFFKAIGFSISKLFEMLTNAYKKITGLRDSIVEYFVGISPTNIKGWLTKIDGFMKEYPGLMLIGGPILAYMIYYIWMYLAAMSGDPEFDFNVSDVWKAFIGTIGFADVFGGVNGAKMLIAVFVNRAIGLTFPWESYLNPSFYFAIGYTLLKAVGSKIPWKKPSQVEIIE